MRRSSSSSRVLRVWGTPPLCSSLFFAFYVLFVQAFYPRGGCFHFPRCAVYGPGCSREGFCQACVYYGLWSAALRVLQPEGPYSQAGTACYVVVGNGLPFRMFSSVSYEGIDASCVPFFIM